MKKNYIFFEFPIVFIFLILPPILQVESNSQVWNKGFYMGAIIQLFIALFLDFQHYYTVKNLKCLEENKTLRFKTLVTVLKWWPLTFGLLMLIYAFFLTLSILFPSVFSSSAFISYSFLDEKSKSIYFFKILFILFSFISAAYYEEVLYRQFFPNSLFFLGDFFLKKKNKVLQFLAESICLVFFALAHRYLGFAAVLNAGLCGLVLRICTIKTKSVYTGTLAHCLYNILLFLVLSKSG